jgi:hypothetical protein
MRVDEVAGSICEAAPSPEAASRARCGTLPSGGTWRRICCRAAPGSRVVENNDSTDDAMKVIENKHPTDVGA